MDDVIRMNDPRQKISPFTFVPEDAEDGANDDSGSESVQVFDLYSRTDLRRIWPVIFEGAHIIHGDEMINTDDLKRKLFRNVFF